MGALPFLLTLPFSGPQGKLAPLITAVTINAVIFHPSLSYFYAILKR